MVISVICTQEISDVTLVQRKKKIATSLVSCKSCFFFLRKFMWFVVTVKQCNILMNLIS